MASNLRILCPALRAPRIAGMKKAILGVLVLIAGAVVYFAAANSRAATETASYTVLTTDGEFELRAYESLHLARTKMNAPMQNGEDRDGSFMRLFRYIAGANEREEKIAMTTPVLVTPDGEKQAMSFVMPKAVVASGVPAPKEGVTLEKLPPMKVAVVRFAGVSSDETEIKQLARLKEWVTAKQLQLLGEPILAYYDPPWTPGFLRRNEVMLRVKE